MGSSGAEGAGCLAEKRERNAPQDQENDVLERSELSATADMNHGDGRRFQSTWSPGASREHGRGWPAIGLASRGPWPSRRNAQTQGGSTSRLSRPNGSEQTALSDG